jgi:hypothetical protein
LWSGVNLWAGSTRPTSFRKRKKKKKKKKKKKSSMKANVPYSHILAYASIYLEVLCLGLAILTCNTYLPTDTETDGLLSAVS